MRKLLLTFLSLMACVCLVLGLTACGNKESKKDSSNDSNNNSVVVETPKPLPTASEVITARNEATSESIQGYDFSLSFTGDFSVLGLGSSLGGKYDGSYRYDGNNDKVTFKRTTSGALLFDSTCYVFSSGDHRIKATMDGSKVKKVSVVLPEEQNITMVNLPITAIINSASENNISKIKERKDSNYAYSCEMSLNNSSTAFSVLSKVFEKLGTGVSFKGITLSGNVSTLDFNLKDGKLTDYRFSFSFQIDIKAVSVLLSVNYEQTANSETISIPDIKGLKYESADIQSEINTINSAIADLKDDSAYSLDLTAENEFDPGWNKNAIVDSYTARMYKNTIDNVAWFNHSYYYKAHSETDGKETYKYTLGNVNGSDNDNQGTWLISRKSSNTQKKVENVTADTQFEFLTAMIKQNANEIDCIEKLTSGTTTTYNIYLGKSATESVQKKITDMIGTNEYEDVTPVNNYFNSENNVKEASIEIVLENGKISSIKCETELCYTPTGGDWTEYNITLNNTIELTVNENLQKAQEYVPPTKVKGTMSFGKNLNDSEYYIA